MRLITIDMDALARAIYSNTDASEQEARSIINTVGFAAPAPASEAVAIGYVTPGALRRLQARENDSITVHAESCIGQDIPVYLAAPPQAAGKDGAQ